MDIEIHLSAGLLLWRWLNSWLASFTLFLQHAPIVLRCNETIGPEKFIFVLYDDIHAGMTVQINLNRAPGFGFFLFKSSDCIRHFFTFIKSPIQPTEHACQEIYDSRPQIT